MRGLLAVANIVDANIEHAPFERDTGRNDRNGIAHRRAVGGTAGPRLVARRVKPPRSSILTEFVWMAYFFVVFAIAVYAMVILVVPHHFNDKIAIMLAAIFAGLILIFARAWLTRRAQSR